jgi:hypothetical protein
LVIVLTWRRFDSLITAREAVGSAACVYVQADRHGCPIRVGKATKGLHARYRGGTGWALDAAGHGSGNVWFVALVPPKLCAAVESTLIWTWREALPFNVQGKRTPPSMVDLRHEGQRPRESN